MRIAFVSVSDPRDVRGWSGTPFHMAKSLRDAGQEIDLVGPLSQGERIVPLRALKFAYRALGRGFLAAREPAVLAGYAHQVRSSLPDEAEYVLSPGTIPIAHLDVDIPVAVWSDATFQGMIDYYPEFTGLSGRSLRHGLSTERETLRRVSAAVYSSEWAAMSAVNDAGADPAKVHVVPFGSNLSTELPEGAAPGAVRNRSRSKVSLLFIGGDWERKGGATAVEVMRGLVSKGIDASITVVGCTPPDDVLEDPHVFVKKRIDKSTADGMNELATLIARSHFLLLPAVADCTPIVFSEANSFAVPVLATATGGIPSMIRNDTNGRLFPPPGDPRAMSEYVAELMGNWPRYSRLAETTLAEYHGRLNWRTSAKKVIGILENLGSSGRPITGPLNAALS